MNELWIGWPRGSRTRGFSLRLVLCRGEEARSMLLKLPYPFLRVTMRLGMLQNPAKSRVSRAVTAVKGR